MVFSADCVGGSVQPAPTSLDAPLIDLLATIGSAPRLALLRHLQVPRTLGEINVGGDRPDAGGVLSRQTVRMHLDRLVDAGLIVEIPTQRAYGDTKEYVVNHARIYALGEDVKSLSRYRATVEPPVVTAGAAATATPGGRGPRFVLVKGLDEGTSFPLAADRSTWVIGRRRDVEVPLDFDPFVSGENAVVERASGEFVVRDCPGSRNGTRVNLRPLGPGETHTLRHGDLIGVGRSALVYWA